MINEIISQISQALAEEFEEKITIYSEEVEQGLETPCFFITLLSPNQTPFLGKRYYNEYPFCIQYISENGSRMHSNEVYERLIDCLEWIEVKENLFRGSKIKSNYIDGILNFYINYNFFVYKTQKDKPEKMEELIMEQVGGK